MREGCLWDELCPPQKNILRVLILSTSEYNPIWRWSFLHRKLFQNEVIRVKLTLIQCDRCPYKKGRCRHRHRHTQWRRCEQTQGQEGRLQTTKRGLGLILPQSPQKEPTLLRLAVRLLHLQICGVNVCG